MWDFLGTFQTCKCFLNLHDCTFKETSANICCYTFSEGWIRPNDVFLLLFDCPYVIVIIVVIVNSILSITLITIGIKIILTIITIKF